MWGSSKEIQSHGTRKRGNGLLGRQYSVCSLRLEIACFCPVYPFYSLYHQLFVNCFRNGNFYGKACNLLLEDHPDCKQFLWKKSQSPQGRKVWFLQKCLSSESLQDSDCEDSTASTCCCIPQTCLMVSEGISICNTQWFGRLCTLRENLGRLGVGNHNLNVVLVSLHLAFRKDSVNVSAGRNLSLLKSLH